MWFFHRRLPKSLLISLGTIMLCAVQGIAQQKNKVSHYPDWAVDVVWYQIFPERFSNGDPNNDPTLKSIHGTWPYDDTSAWELHRWTTDWYQLQTYEQRNGKDIWYNIARRRYGGDLQGIINRIPYLDSLGIGAVYFNPVFWAPSHHKYDAIMYHHIDPYFGPDPEGDMAMIARENPTDPKTWKWTSADLLALKMIQEFHKRGIRVIFDGVFNHMGQMSFAFQDVLKRGKKSKYKDWFSIKSWADTEDGLPFEYEGWFGVNELPEIREDEKGIVAGPKKYIFDCTRRWMSPNGKVKSGIDGWRLDVAFCVNHQFWKDWRQHVKSINPEAYLTAEVIERPDDLKPYLQGDEFDAVMNYNFTFYLTDFFIGRQFNPSQLDSALRYLREAFPDRVAAIMQNLLGSHDTNRVGSHVVNGNRVRFSNWGEYFGWSKASNPDYLVRKPEYPEWEIVKQMLVFQMTYLGAPMIYYGDEVGMHGANDPDCRKPMIWPEKEYDFEAFNPDQTKRNPDDIVAFDHELFDFHRKLIQLRKKHVSLRRGSFKTIKKDDVKGLFAFERTNEGERIICIFNQSDSMQTCSIASDHDAKDLLSNKIYASGGSFINLQIQPRGYILMKRLE